MISSVSILAMLGIGLGALSLTTFGLLVVIKRGK